MPGRAGIKLEGDQGEIVSLQDQTYLCSELREKFKCVDYIGKDERWAKLLPKNQKKNFFFILTSSLIPEKAGKTAFFTLSSELQIRPVLRIIQR